MKDHPAVFQASPLVREQLSQYNTWHENLSKKINTVMNCMIVIFIFSFICIVVATLVKMKEGELISSNQDIIVASVSICFGVLFIGVTAMACVCWRMSKIKPSTVELDRHVERLIKLGELTDTPWETFMDEPRFYERVVKPKLAAYYAGTVQLIQDHHGVESHEWYDKYRELYILARALLMHPIGTPYEPISYEWIDDHTTSSAAIFEG